MANEQYSFVLQLVQVHHLALNKASFGFRIIVVEI